MIVVGGLPSYTAPWNFEDPPADPWPQGLGILDLPSLSWSDHYDADTPAYDSPDIVKHFYNNGYVGVDSIVESANNCTVAWRLWNGKATK